MITWLRWSGMVCPLALYLLMLAAVNRAKRPVVLPGALDAFAWWMGVSGLLAMGPAALLLQPFFVGDPAGAALGGILAVASLAAIFIAFQKPSIVIYRCTEPAFRATCAAVLAELDEDWRQLADVCVAPRLGLHVRLECSPRLHNVTVVLESAGENPENWKRLQRLLEQRLAKEPTSQRSRALPWMLGIVAAALLLTPVGWLLRDEQVAGEVLRILGRRI